MTLTQNAFGRKNKKSCEVPPENSNKVKAKVHDNKNNEKEARILLRRVDSALKTEGVEAAVKELMQVRMVIPLNTLIRVWLRDYRDMLDAWQNQIMPEVVDEFYAFGFRRARNIACKAAGMARSDRKIPYYIACERALGEMAERSRLAVTDSEEAIPRAIPKTVSLEDVPASELNRGTKL